MANFKPGDSVLFQRGDTWELATGGEANSLNIYGINGSSGNEITFSSFGTGARPIFDATNNGSGVAWRGVISFRNVSYIIFSGIKVYNSSENAIDICSWDSPCDDSCTYVTVQDCEVDTIRRSAFQGVYVGHGSAAAGAQTVNNITFTENIVHGSGHNCIRFQNVQNSEISKNTVYDCSHVGIDFNWESGWDSYSSNNVSILYNDISDSGTGIYPNHLDNSEIAYNIIYDSIDDAGKSGGINLKGETANKANGPDGLTIYSNIIWDIDACSSGCSETSAIYYGYDQNLDIYNNTLYSNYRSCKDAGNHDTINYTNNLAYASSQSGCEADYPSDPQFVNPGADNFKLQSTSPVIDQGSDLGNGLSYGILPGSTFGVGGTVTRVDQDHFGSGWEIGAYVFYDESAEAPDPPTGLTIISPP